MGRAMIKDESVVAPGGCRLHVRLWPGEGVPFLLLHGLASNCRMWDRTADLLARAGHAVAAVDLRGHGRSDRPAAGYDFATVADDVAAVLDALGWVRPVVVGQSWGGNVAVAFGARHPGRSRGLGLVDGGFIDLGAAPGATWESVSRALRPPDLAGLPTDVLRARIRSAAPDWSDDAVDAMMTNFETLPDGTVRPWLPLALHMKILRAMWDEPPLRFYPAVREPVLLCVAGRGLGAEPHHRRAIATARAALPRIAVRWFPHAPHDIHVHDPEGLAGALEEEHALGVWAGGWQKPGSRTTGAYRADPNPVA